MNNKSSQAKTLVLIDNIVARDTLLKKALLVTTGAVAIAISAQLYIPIQPVPITLQSFMVLMVGATLGRSLGVYSTILYIMLGIIGLPFFAENNSGLGILFMPSFGYIIGFVFASYIAGLASEQIRKTQINKLNFFKYLLYLAIAHHIIFVFGIAWLTFAFNSFSNAMVYGYLPFLGVDAIKYVSVAIIISVTWKSVDKYKLN